MTSNVLDTQQSRIKTHNQILVQEPSDENDRFLNQSLAERFFYNKKYNYLTPHLTPSDQEDDEEEQKNIQVYPSPHLGGQNLKYESSQQMDSRGPSRLDLTHQQVPPTRNMYANLIQYFLLKTFARKLSKKKHLNSQFNEYHFNVINDKGSVLNLKLFKDNALRLKPMYQTSKTKINQSLAQIILQRILTWIFMIYTKTTLKFQQIPLFYPESMTKLIWDGFVQVARVYFMFLIPMDLSFNEQFMFGQVYSTTVIMLTILILDFLISFNTAQYMQGRIVTKRLSIANQIVWQSWGLEIASVTFLVLLWCLVELDNGYQVDATSQLYQLALMGFFIQFRNISKFLRQIENAFNLSMTTKAIVELIKLILAIIVVLHIFACLWYWAGQYSHVQSGISWLDQRALVGQGWHKCYLYSFYFSSVTMFTVGYGDITPQSDLEVIVSICFMMLTTIQLSYSVSTVGLIIDKLQLDEEEKLKKLQTINTFMQNKQIDYELQYQVREYLNYFWQAQNEEDTQQEKTIIDQLSENLRLRLMQEANSLILNNCLLFSNHFSKQLKNNLVKHFLQVAVQPEDMIDFDRLIPDQQNNQIYLCFIEKGSIQVQKLHDCKILIENEGNSIDQVNDSEVSVVNQLYEGESLGLISFITGKKSTERYRSIGFTKLLLLNRDDFLKIIQDFPEDNEQFKNFEDQFKLYQSSDFQMQCFSCRSPDHTAINCPLLHFTPDREFLIKKEQFSRNQMRNEPTKQVYKRRGKRAIRSTIQNQGDIKQSAVYLQNDYWQETLFYDCDLEDVSSPKKNLISDDQIIEVKNKKSITKTQKIRPIPISKDDLNEQQSQESFQNIMVKSSEKKNIKSLDLNDQSINDIELESPEFNKPQKDQEKSKFTKPQKFNMIQVQGLSQDKNTSITSILPIEKKSFLRAKFQNVVQKVISSYQIVKTRANQKNRVRQEVGISDQQSIFIATFEKNQINNLMQRRKRFIHNTNLTHTSLAFQRDSQCAEFTILKLQMMTDMRPTLINFETSKTFKFYFPHNNIEAVLLKQETYYKPNQQRVNHLPQIFSQLVQYMMYPYDYIERYKFESIVKDEHSPLKRLNTTIKNLVISSQKKVIMNKITRHPTQIKARSMGQIPQRRSKIDSL